MVEVDRLPGEAEDPVHHGKGGICAGKCGNQDDCGSGRAGKVAPGDPRADPAEIHQPQRAADQRTAVGEGQAKVEEGDKSVQAFLGNRAAQPEQQAGQLPEHQSAKPPVSRHK